MEHFQPQLLLRGASFVWCSGNEYSKDYGEKSGKKTSLGNSLVLHDVTGNFAS